MIKYYLPIFLDNDNVSILQLDKNIKIRKMTPKEKEDFFGIKKVDFGIKNNAIFINQVHLSKTTSGRYGYNKMRWRHLMDGTENIFVSNYVVEISSDDDIDDIVKNLNLSFNILNPTNTRCYLNFKQNDTSVGFFMEFEKTSINLGYLNFAKKEDLKNLSAIYKKINQLKKRERLKFELFMEGMHSQTSDELKFLSLVIALENMFLPGQSGELKFKFSLRIAKMTDGKIAKKNKKEVYDTVGKIYAIRSSIVHDGYSKNLTSAMYAQTINILWVALVEYLNAPKNFEEKYLTDILLYDTNFCNHDA